MDDPDTWAGVWGIVQRDAREWCRLNGFHALMTAAVVIGAAGIVVGMILAAQRAGEAKQIKCPGCGAMQEGR